MSHDQFDVPLTTVHDALDDATVVARLADSADKDNISFRIHIRKKALLKKICNTRGANVTDYLRACTDALIRDYLPPGEFDKLQLECGEFNPRQLAKASS